MLRLVSSVRVRLTAAVTIVFATFLTLAAFGLVRQLESALVNDIQVRNDTVTGALGRMLQSGRLSADSLTDAQQVADELATNGTNSQMIQEGITDSIIYVAGPGVGGLNSESSPLDRLRQSITNQVTPLFGRTMPSLLDQNHFAISRVRVDTPSGQVVLSVASPLDGVKRTVNRVGTALFFTVPTLVAAVALMAWFMTGRTLRPVEAITKRANEITGSTLHERVPEPRTDDEIGQLARTMNAMLDRLEGSSDRQKRFMSDASHELRSPVASIKLQLETALLGGESTDWDSVARTVLTEDERLESLVANLLAMTRLEEGVRRPSTEVDLDEVVYDQAARPTRVPIDRSAVSAAKVFGVPAELTSVVRNLLDNAVRHATTQVRVVLSHPAVGEGEAPIIRLMVEDDGPGVPEDQRATVFERFARLQEGRSRDAGGSGLGLALTKRIVESSGGTVTVTDSALGGAAFIVELPAIAED